MLSIKIFLEIKAGQNLFFKECIEVTGISRLNHYGVLILDEHHQAKEARWNHLF